MQDKVAELNEINSRGSGNLGRIEELLATHQRNRNIALAFLTVSLALLFVVEMAYSLHD